MIFTITAKLDNKVAYFSMPKVATRSVRRTFLQSEEERQSINQKIQETFPKRKEGLDNPEINIALFRSYPTMGNKDFALNLIGVKGITFDGGVWVLSGYEERAAGFAKKEIDLEEVNSYFIFTFVRNPFSRLVSCFQHKYNFDEREQKFIATPIMRNKGNFPSIAKDFADFAQQINQKPDEGIDYHIKKQSAMIGVFTELGGKIGFIGQLENIVTQFEPIRQKYGLLPLEVRNSSAHKAQHQKWQDYYTPETARLVYERYLDDFKQFDYQAEYPKLLAYLNAPLPWRFRKRRLLGKLGVKRYQKVFGGDMSESDKI